MRPNRNEVDPFLPHPARIVETVDLTPDIRLLRIRIEEPRVSESFNYRPGQFAFLSAFGVGEAPFTFVLLYGDPYLEFAIRRVGTVTSALHELEPGAFIGIRGPYGNIFPLDEYKGKKIVIIGGGIGLAPLRPVIRHVLKHRQDYAELLIIYGARTPQDLVFASEYEEWASSPATRLELTVDRGDEGWTGRVALVPQVVKEVASSPENAIAIICGPPIMIRFTLVELTSLGFTPQQIVTTLEAKMKCRLGKCARCNLGDKYVCRDDPVFTMEQISRFLEPI